MTWILRTFEPRSCVTLHWTGTGWTGPKWIAHRFSSREEAVAELRRQRMLGWRPRLVRLQRPDVTGVNVCPKCRQGKIEAGVVSLPNECCAVYFFGAGSWAHSQWRANGR